MEELEQLVREVIIHHRSQLARYEGLASLRMRVIQEMTQELLSLKQLYIKLYPENVEEINSTFKQLQNDSK
jgi:hypothetical protein